MILLDRASRLKVFIWSFISRGRFSIILRISSRTVREELDDEDGSVIGYTSKGGGIIVVFIARGFLKR